MRCSRDYPAAGGSSGRRRGRGGKRLKHQESSEQTVSQSPAGPVRGLPGVPALGRPSNSSMPLGPAPSSSSWPTSGSQVSIPSVPYPPGVLPLYPVYPPLSHPASDPNVQTGLRFPLQNSQMAPPMVHPMMALVLPNYMFPQPNMGMPQPFFCTNSAFPFPTANTAPAPVPNPAPRAHSRSSTPQSYSQREAGPEREGAESPLFQSRCSSPLNLLQLEETPSNRFETSALTSGQPAASPMVGQGGGAGGQASSNQRAAAVDSKENENVRQVPSKCFLKMNTS